MKKGLPLLRGGDELTLIGWIDVPSSDISSAFRRHEGLSSSFEHYTPQWRCDFSVSLGFAEGVEVDAELLALFVEVAAFEAEGAGDVGHVEIVAVDFGEKGFALEGFGAFEESALGGAGAVNGDRHGGRTGSRESEADVVGVDGFSGGEED